MAVSPSQVLGLDLVWRGAPRVRLASGSVDTIGLDAVWRGAPLVADVDATPLDLWAEPLLELDGAAESQVVESLWGAGVVSLFGSTATLATAAEVQAGGVLRVEGEATAGMASGLDADAELAFDGWLYALYRIFTPLITLRVTDPSALIHAGLDDALDARASTLIHAGLGAALPASAPRPSLRLR